MLGRLLFAFIYFLVYYYLLRQDNIFVLSKNKPEKSMEKTIIPIASGKGGVGKSFVAANLSIALAELGKKVIVADLDFGGSNLHTCLGIKNIHPGIGDFVRAHLSKLDNLLVETEHENLRFLAGDVRSPFLANMRHVQKMRLISNFKQLECEYLILDLGSGSTYNTLDFFGMTHLGMIITTTEHTANMNMLTFLKLFAFRVIERSLPKNTFLDEKMRDSYNRTVAEEFLTVSGILEEISKIDRNIANEAEQNWIRYRPRIIFNKCNLPGELDIVPSIENHFKQNLMLKGDYFGCLFTDAAVTRAFQERKTLKNVEPYSHILEDIHILADRITRLWKKPIRNSASLLQSNSKDVFEKRLKK